MGDKKKPKSVWDDMYDATAGAASNWLDDQKKQAFAEQQKIGSGITQNQDRKKAMDFQKGFSGK